MYTPIVTIVIATYNSERTIRTALQSVADQTFQEWECLVIDGASTDGTVDAVKEFSSKDSRFRIISEPDKGIYDAFNKGWKNAKGEWIYYMGCDDRLLKDGLKSLMDVATSDYAVISGHVKTLRIDGSIGTWKSVGFGGCHQGKVTLKSALQNIGGYNLKYTILADLDLYTRLNNCEYKVLNVDAYIAFFNKGGVSQNNSYIIKRYKERKCIYNENKSVRYPTLKAGYVSTMEFAKNIVLSFMKFLKRA